MAGKILIIDGVATNRIVFKVKLGEACYQPILAADGKSGLAMAATQNPDLILLDYTLPDIQGIEVLKALRTHETTRNIPVVVLSANKDVSLRIEALQAGADDFFCKPVDDQTLMARVRSLLRLHEDIQAGDGSLHVLGLAEAPAGFEAQGQVALIADRPEVALRWRNELQALLSDRIVILTREEALAEGRNGPTSDIFVIDADLGGNGAGLRLMSDLRSRTATRHAAICIIRPAGAEATAAMAFDLGANDQVAVGVQPRELGSRLRNLMRRKRLGDRMRLSVQDGLRLALIDPLTGLHNRRYAMPQLGTIAELAQTEGTSFAVMVVDLDRFKAVNDHWGHAAGDAVLVEVARRMARTLRSGDLLARIGGEEFMVCLPDSDLADACATAQRLCQIVQARPIRLPGNESLSVTVSIGLAISDLETAQHFSAVIDQADQALLLAKMQGRNKVTISRSAA